MRIIGGAWRGRPLAAVGTGDVAAHLRPTSDRVRESLFNILMSRFDDPVSDACVLDVFAGTGALGLEALSRGAACVTFVEHGRPALALLRENLRRLGADGQIIARDARKPGPAPKTPCDLVFLDPPYGKALGEAALLATQDWLAPGALIVWEEGHAITVPQGFTVLDSRSYGETKITFLHAP